MRRLLVAAAVAAAVVSPVAPASASRYYRSCGGVVDYQCEGWVCPTDCWYRDCLVWVDARHDPMLAVCVQPVPR
jgi:hypothetical protein